jgi:DNA-binding transcriptional ArsR family regulator
MGSSGERWINDAAGPIIRPYALVGGRTQASGGGFNLIAMVAAVRGVTADPSSLEPEHLLVLRICRLPTSVADLAAELSLPLGVVRIILADLREQGLVTIRRPVPPAQLPDIEILRRVANGLRRL